MAIVLGGLGLIGAAVSTALADAGANVLILDIDEEEVMELMDGRGFPRYNGVIMIDEEIM